MSGADRREGELGHDLTRQLRAVHRRGYVLHGVRTDALFRQRAPSERTGWLHV